VRFIPKITFHHQMQVGPGIQIKGLSALSGTLLPKKTIRTIGSYGTDFPLCWP